MELYIPVGVQFSLRGEAYAPPPIPEFTFGILDAPITHIPVPRLVVGVSSRWSRPGHTLAAASRAAWGGAPPREALSISSWGIGFTADERISSGWGAIPARALENGVRWRPATPARTSPTWAPWRDVPTRDAGRVIGWDRSIRPRDTLRLRLIYSPRPALKDQRLAGRFQRVNEFGPRVSSGASPPYIPGASPLAFAFAGNRYTPSTTGAVFFQFETSRTVGRIAPVDGGTADRWQNARQINLRRQLPWGPGRPKDPGDIDIGYPDYNGPVYEIDPAVEPDILETYMIANSVQLVVLPGREPVDATSIKLSRDIDAFAWTLNFDLFGRTSLNLVKPGAGGPKTVEVTINGWVWLCIVERYSEQTKFPAERYSVTGASRTQMLAEPYAPKRSAVNAADINAVQAATDQLENTGFTLSWDYTALGPPDWTIPAGAFSYQEQTALQVIARVAEAVGGVVKPSRDSDALAVVPRYREAPWNWSTAVMDRIIPAEIVSGVGGEWSPHPAWNSCYVSGTTHGVAVDVRRAGTAGDAPAPDVYDDLITGTDAARHRGIAEIAKGGDQEIVTRTLPLFPFGGSAPGLVEPAHLCEIRDPDEIWRGLCLSTEITATGVGSSRVTQTLKLERHHA